MQRCSTCDLANFFAHPPTTPLPTGGVHECWGGEGFGHSPGSSPLQPGHVAWVAGHGAAGQSLESYLSVLAWFGSASMGCPGFSLGLYLYSSTGAIYFPKGHLSPMSGTCFAGLWLADVCCGVRSTCLFPPSKFALSLESWFR